MAMNRKFKGANGEEREEVTFVDCVVFGKAAETLNKWVTKGKPIYLQGRLKYDSWEAKDGGGKRSKLSVVVDNFQFLGQRDGGGEEQEQRPPSRTGQPVKPPVKDPFSEEQQFKEADIPF